MRPWVRSLGGWVNEATRRSLDEHQKEAIRELLCDMMMQAVTKTPEAVVGGE